MNDKGAIQYIPPTLMHFVTGTWSDAAGAVAGTIAKAKAAADNTGVVNIPIMPPASKKDFKGAKVASIDIWFDISTAALDALAAVVNLVTMGADGAAPTVAAQTFTYDAGHDTAAERIDVDEHKMTLTLADAIYLDDAQQLLVELTVDAAATSVFKIRGAQVNYTSRL